MEYMIGLSVLLIVGAVASVVGLGRGGGTTGTGGMTRGRARSGGDAGTTGMTGMTGPTGLTGLAAEAEANHWVVRLGESMIVPDARQWAGADEGTGQALSYAMEHHRIARERLARARSAEEYEEVARTAREGLRHVRVAREGLGLGVG
ncbi:hypothetical protein [Streptomyces sp. 4F14]|uniref:hypothetical protein n=1 Tax=Streptomyces sp. 4F14 TaxID=3394380 RepID=UPI003A88EEAC